MHDTGKSISERNYFNYIFKMCCYVRMDKAHCVAKVPVISKWNSEIPDVDNVGMKIFFFVFFWYISAIWGHIFIAKRSVLINLRFLLPRGSAASSHRCCSIPAANEERQSAFLLPPVISTSSPLPLSSRADGAFIICMCPAPLPLLCSDVVPSLSNLPTHSSLCYWPGPAAALSFFCSTQTKRDFKTCVLSLFFWVKTVVRSGASKFRATKGAEEHRRLSRGDCQFWACAFSLKILFCGGQALFGSVLYICYFMVPLSETNVRVK